MFKAEYKLCTKKPWRSIASARFANKGEEDFFHFKSNRVWFETYKPPIFFRLYLGVFNILTGSSHYVYMCQYIDSNIWIAVCYRLYTSHFANISLALISLKNQDFLWGEAKGDSNETTCATRLQYYSISRGLSRHTHDDNGLCAVCVCVCVCVCTCLSQRETFGGKTMLERARELLCYCLHIASAITYR